MQAARGAAVTRRHPRLFAAAVAAAVIGADQLTKTAVVHALAEGASRPVIDDFLRLSHFRNSGAAFGTLPGFGGVFALAAIVGIIVFAAVVVRKPPFLTALGAALVAGGAAGNLADRVFRAHGVVDFVDFRFWPAFNVADSAITIGAILLLWAGLTDRSKAASSRDPSDEDPSDEPAQPRP